LTALKYSFFSRKIGGSLAAWIRQTTHSKKNGDEQGEDREERVQRSLLKAFAGTVKHYLGIWQSIFEGVRDSRNPEMIIYPLEGLMCTGVLMFLFRLGARREINYKLRGNDHSRTKFLWARIFG
jgi:hypothetical protein